MSNELAVRSNPFEPTDLNQAMTLAKTLATSQLIPRALVGKPADVLLIMIKGRELGISTMQAISGINIIQGKPVIASDLMIGLILSHPDVCEYFTPVVSNDKIATYKTKRRGSEPVEMSFTLEEAQAAKLTGKDNWRNFPAAMLRARASAALGRAVYPDLVAGVYVPGEIPDEPHGGSPEPKPRAAVIANAKAALAELETIKPPPPVVEAPAASDDPNPFHTDPEFRDDSKEHKAHVAEEAYKLMKVPSGKAKGQYLEAQPTSYLIQLKEHVEKGWKDGGNKYPKDVALAAGCEYWLRKKAEAAEAQLSDADDFEAEVAKVESGKNNPEATVS